MGDYAGGNAQSKPCSFHIIPRLHDEPGVAIHIFSNIFDKVTYILTDDEAVFVFNHKDKFFKKSSHFISEETHFIESTIQAQGLDYGALEVTITNKIIEDGRIKKDTTIECTVI